MGKYLNFVDLTNPVLQYKTKLFAVDTKETGQRIGAIKWLGTFSQYAFFPHDNTTYGKDSLQEIMDFLNQLMEEWRANKRKQLPPNT